VDAKSGKLKKAKLERPSTTLGRSSSADVRVGDKSVSRAHCRMEWSARDGAVALVDLGSSLGSAVNGAPVARKYLRPGDHLTLGKCLVQFLAVPR